jgi:hypothetical protein
VGKRGKQKPSVVDQLEVVANRAFKKSFNYSKVLFDQFRSFLARRSMVMTLLGSS